MIESNIGLSICGDIPCPVVYSLTIHCAISSLKLGETKSAK